jgi:hypothetical protein
MSEREEIQNDMADFLESAGLDEVYGVLTGLDTLANGRKVRTVTFCRARTLDGCVTIYGPTFIKVATTRDNETFASAEDAKAWIQARYVDFDQDAADEVPRK